MLRIHPSGGNHGMFYPGVQTHTPPCIFASSLPPILPPPNPLFSNLYSNYILLSKDTPPSLSRCRALNPRSPSSSRYSPLTFPPSRKKTLRTVTYFRSSRNLRRPCTTSCRLVLHLHTFKGICRCRRSKKGGRRARLIRTAMLSCL
jgi:hypothetical protein